MRQSRAGREAPDGMRRAGGLAALRTDAARARARDTLEVDVLHDLRSAAAVIVAAGVGECAALEVEVHALSRLGARRVPQRWEARLKSGGSRGAVAVDHA